MISSSTGDLGTMPTTGSHAGDACAYTWLDAPVGPALARMHPGAPAAPVGVLVVPPVGWDDMASFSPRREWAGRLAADGVPVVGLDLPGTGDSAGTPLSPDLVNSWVTAINGAAAWLRERSGCASVVALAFSVGGLLVLRAAAAGAAIDHFALWACQPTGASFIRELTAFSRLEASRLERDDRDAARGTLPAGAILAGGYLFTAETLASIRELDPGAMTLPAIAGRRALLLGRGRAPDRTLVSLLEGWGVEVATSHGDGYEGMLVEPQFARLPDGAVEDLGVLLADVAGSVPPPPAGDPPASPARGVLAETEMDEGPGWAIREQVLAIDHGGVPLLGVLSDSAASGAAANGADGPDPATLGAILIGGTGHRMGPNRMWTALGRRWALRGVPTLRVDVAGAGEAGTPMPASVSGLYTESDLIDQIADVVAAFRAQTGCTVVLLVGLCAGGFWAIRTALADPDVIPVTLNLPLLRWNEAESAAHAGRLYRGKLMQPRTLRRILVGDIDFGNAVRRLPAVLGLPVGSGPAVGDLSPAEMLDALDARRRATWFQFAGSESLGDDMRSGGPLDLATRPSLHLDHFGPRSDLHTLRPLWVQQELFARLDRVLNAELAGES